MRAPPPANEARRLAALLSCDVLDTEPEPSFDDIARLAGQLCGTPIAVVSLIDRDRQWFKASVGLDERETSRDVSFCAHALGSPDPLVVHDARADARFADNPMVVGDPHIRFYAGVPLMLESDIAAGTLCVLDHVPRELSRAQLDALAALARQVAGELRLRRSVETWRRRSVRPGAEPEGGGRAVEGHLVAERYRIERVLGVGGMGIVAAARDEADGVDVAIKFLHAELERRPDVQERFVREARAALRVGGEQVARVLDVGNLGSGAPFIVMERLLGEDLEARMAAGPMPVGEAVDVVLQACAAVGRAHAAGVLHRDLKPANLFLCARDDGSRLVKILDFGISKFAAPDAAPKAPRLTDDSALLGSPHYMSPEQMKGASDVDGRTDVWALGVILYELLAGAPPFPGDSQVEVCTAVMTMAPPPLGALRPELPAALVAVVERCLAKDRDARVPSIDALASALAPFAPAPQLAAPADEPDEPVIDLVTRVASVRPSATTEPVVRRPLRATMLGERPAWAVALVLALLLVAVVLIMAGTGPRAAP